MTLAVKRPESDVAVIDVGSNSVRLVLYRVEGRAVWTVFNEKVLAGLGRNLSTTGRLAPEGIAEAMSSLRRFGALLEDVPPTSIFTAATAAVRQASDGPAFVERVARETGIRLRVIGGDEEARYAALGVLAGAPQSIGVVADLGGASLELKRVNEDGPGVGVSLPVGPFSMGNLNDASPDRLRKKLRSLIEPIAVQFNTHTLHAVGGAWRNLALLQMRMSNYPLEIVHQYELSRREMIEAVQFVSRQSRGSLERIPGLSRKRVETLPHAALVMEVLVDVLGLEKIVMSAYGLREGLILDSLSPEVRLRDPLIEGCQAWGARQGVSDSLGPAVEAWVRPLFAGLPPAFGARDQILISAACALADIGARTHPDHRADLVFDQVLRAPIAGLGHNERYFLAAVCFSRHTAAATARRSEIATRLLSPERLIQARALGSAIRLACDLSGRSTSLLARSSLMVEGDKLVVSAEPDYADILLGEQTAKRAVALANLLGRRLELRPELLAKAV